MKYITTVFLAVVSINVFALTETVDGITWTYVITNGCAAVGNGTSSGRAVSTSVSGSITVPSSLGGYRVVRINNNAFYECRNLTAITIPSSVTSIGGNIFYDCRNLWRLNVEDIGAWCRTSADGSVLQWSAYDANTGRNTARYMSEIVDKSTGVTVTDLIVPDGVTSIGRCAFRSYKKLRSVSMADSVTNVEVGVFFQCENLGNVVLPSNLEAIGADAFGHCSSLTNVVMSTNVATIGSYAFAQCGRLADITIPASVMSVGEQAFSGCDLLFDTTSRPGLVVIDGWVVDTIESPSGILDLSGVRGVADSVFSGCSNLTCVTAVDGLACIGNNAFNNCSDLTSVMLPNGMSHIGEGAFNKCSGLMSVMLPNSVNYIGEGAFSECDNLVRVAVPQCVSSISEMFPGSYRTLTSVAVDEGATNVADRLFAGCAGLVNVAIPTSIVSIGKDIFSGCTQIDRLNIEDIAAWTQINFDGPMKVPYDLYLNDERVRVLNIPNGVHEIKDWAFADCASLEEVVFPDGLETIGEGAFLGCTNLTRVAFRSRPNSFGALDLRSIELDGCQSTNGYRVYKGWILGYEDSSASRLEIPDGIIGIAPYALSDFWDLEEIVLPESLKYIGYGAFMNDTYLNGVVIPDGVEYIDGAAFKNCTYLRNVRIGDGVRRIGSEAFCNCSQLTILSIPDGVASIGDGVCSNCWRMTSVKLPLGLESIGRGVFTKCTSLIGAAVPTSRFTMRQVFEDRYDKLASVSIVPGETEICVSAFEGCVAFSAIDIPEGITNCGDRAFYGCTKLAEIVLPDSVRTIGRESFVDCSMLKYIVLSRNLEAIPDYAFYTRTTTLNYDLIIPASVRHLGKYICHNVSYNGDRGCFRVFFLGNAPEYDADAYKGCGVVRFPKTYVVQGSRGWDGIPSSRDLPEKWIGKDIAFWTPTRFSAIFNANGGRFNGEEETVVCEEMTDTGFIIPASTPTRRGYEFLGWWTAVDGGTQVKTTARVSQTSETTIYAHWALVEGGAEVRFNPNGGTGDMPNQTFAHGEDWVLASNRFAYAGHMFLGWSWAPDGDVAYVDGEIIQDISEMVGETVTLFAVWARDSSNVTFIADGEKAWELARFARNGEAVWQSGAIGDNQTSVMEAYVRGNGTIAFDWQASCEDSFRGMRLDYLAFFVDGVEKAFVNGSTEWATESFVIEGAGEHVLRWVYVKDSDGSDYDDCGRVSSVTWSPSLSTLGEFLNVPSIDFSTSGDASWSGQTIVSHDGVASLRSGAISDGGMTRLECTVSGPGELSFWWKASCEAPFRGVPLDFAEFSVDGVQKEWIAGETDWTNAIVSVEGSGSHVLAWTYQKDDWEGTSDGEDCAWVDEVSWTPAADADVTVDVGGGKFVIVSGAWLLEKTTKEATDAAANGRKVWECYVLGLDPEDSTNDFKIVSFPMKADGTPDISAIAFDPPEAKWNVQGATPVLKGKATLEGTGEWQTVTDENKAGMRFFKVEVMLP